MRFQVRRRSHCQKAEELYSSSTRLLGCSLPARASPAKRTPADNRIFPVAGAGAGMEMTGVYLSDVRRIRLLPAIVPLWCAPGSTLLATGPVPSARLPVQPAAEDDEAASQQQPPSPRALQHWTLRRGSKPATASHPALLASAKIRQSARTAKNNGSVGFS
jgi:hypothetical protein